MNIPKACLFLVLCSLLVSESGARAGTQASFYVSPAGNDNNAGTQNAPLKTIIRARDIARTINGNMTGDIIVYLRGGTYLLASPIQFTERDGGTSGHQIIYKAYPGEIPIISGATQGDRMDAGSWKCLQGNPQQGH